MRSFTYLSLAALLLFCCLITSSPGASDCSTCTNAATCTKATLIVTPILPRRVVTAVIAEECTTTIKTTVSPSVAVSRVLAVKCGRRGPRRLAGRIVSWRPGDLVRRVRARWGR